MTASPQTCEHKATALLLLPAAIGWEMAAADQSVPVEGQGRVADLFGSLHSAGAANVDPSKAERFALGWVNLLNW